VPIKAKPWILVLFILLISLIFAQTQSAAAGAYYYFSGNELVEAMREYDAVLPGGANYYSTKTGAAITVGEYFGYVLGVCDGTADEQLYEIRADVTKQQILAVVSKYLKNHPEKWSEPAAFLVVEALQEAFPLKSQR
jgi:hypothetical protein